MNLKVLILVFYTLFGVNIVAENHTRQVSINWQPSVREVLSEHIQVTLLHFSHAVYDENHLPRYSERIPLKRGQGAENATVTNIQWERLPESSNFVGLTHLTDKEVFEQGVYAERNERFLWFSLLPLRKNSDGSIDRIRSFTISYDIIPYFPQADKRNRFASSSVLSQGSWYKFSVGRDGIYKITYNDLVTMGVNPSNINPSRIQVYGNGGGMLPEANDQFRHDDLVENPIIIIGGDDGSFDPADYILLFAQGPHRWRYNSGNGRFSHSKNIYNESACFFLRTDGQNGKRISLTDSHTDLATHTFTTFSDFTFFDHDSINLIKSGKEWFAEAFDILNSYQHTLSIPDIVSSEKAVATIRVAARSTVGSPGNNFIVQIGSASVNIPIANISVSYNSEYAKIAVGELEFTPASSTMTFTITYSKPTQTSNAWLDYILINAKRRLNIPSSGQLVFREPQGVGAGNISEYNITGTTASTMIWDVTDPVNPFRISASFGSGSLSFRAATDSLREFVAFDPAKALSPTYIGSVSNQNLHSLRDIDMVIVVYPPFISEANRLAQFHRDNSGYKVAVCTPEQIYNEFSSGNQDITAIRMLMKMLYETASQPSRLPSYLLLFGDGSYDYKDIIPQNTNFIPTFQSQSSLSPTSSFASDDYFGMLDDNEGSGSSGYLDIGIGRFPVQTLEEAKAAVDKTILYKTRIRAQVVENACDWISSEGTFGDWKNDICFIADDEDNNLHFSQADFIARTIDTAYPIYNIDKIYFDAYRQEVSPAGQRYPDVQDAINRRMDRGVFLMNYTGHGGETGWAHERVLTVQDINAWRNKYKMPVFMTATCEFSRFDDPGRVSAGEYVFLNPEGGGVALFSTTRLVYSSSNFELNKRFNEFVFEHTIEGKRAALGDINRLSKNAASGPTSINNRNFTLLGDPGLRLAFPVHQVHTYTINGNPIADADTISALSKVTVTGYVTDINGQKLNGYNGVLYPTVFDKPANLSTLGNDPPPASYPAPFQLQRNIIYKGKASVKNGEFSFTFIVPKDISYKYGKGKISYYAESEKEDATGAFREIVIGGTADNIPVDNQGPEISLFMNNEQFVFGGVTDENPVLLAVLNDENGINTVGNGIGHDIVLVLNGNTDKSITLNEYYEADLDSYQQGRVRYQLKDLPEGRHYLTLKAWDTHNNSTTAYIEFMVAKSTDLELKHVYNYPNPFSTRTSFIFEHNQPCCTMDVRVSIYTLTGKLVKTIYETIETTGYRVHTDEIVWDGLDDYGKKIGKGVYIYKLFVRSDNGTTAEKIQKLVILN